MGGTGADDKHKNTNERQDKNQKLHQIPETLEVFTSQLDHFLDLFDGNSDDENQVDQLTNHDHCANGTNIAMQSEDLDGFHVTYTSH